ncbi:hypothetical protein B0H10DRAFT_1942523 [Mycena sp. CBHHK59/15]|nr:hypothetical protein B0H10DRAFT_1942523 [Mycena sp. CBHHK59/15]
MPNTSLNTCSPSTDASSPTSQGVTFVINLQGPRPFTLNINLSHFPGAQDLGFSVAANSETHPNGNLSTDNTQLSQRTRNVRHRKSMPTPSNNRTPCNGSQPQHQFFRQFVRTTDDRESQDVEVPETPRSELNDCSDTEDSDMYEDDQPVAVFSPSNQNVTPSRKRKLGRMA